MMVLRYVTIAAAVAATLFGAINLGVGDAEVILVDAGQSGLSAHTSVWVLGMVVAAAIYSFRREGAVCLPLALRAWAGGSKTWLFAGSALVVVAACACS